MFKKKVVGIELGNSNVLRTPFAFGKLECGHLVSAGQNRHKQTCSKCETQYIHEEQNPTKENGWKLCPNCGHNGSTRDFEVLSVHLPENQTVKVGDEFDCKDCTKNDKNLKFILENREKILYARFRKFGEYSSHYHCYQRDPTSPSGVKLFGGVEATKEVEEAFRKVGLCTVSPTEGLYAPSKFASGYDGI